ncbi:MAG: metallophosphoesterase, partial [Clostridiales bacterium]|nr:metallophosphoesterase [Clostridiales bacterium]
MAYVKTDAQYYSDIGAAIREKNGLTTKYKPSQMGDAVRGITTGDQIAHADIPRYVKAEALAVAEKVKNVQNANTLTFFVISDPHHCASQSDGWAAQTNESNLHAMMGAKILAYALDADFSVCNGDFTFGNKSTTADQLKEQVREIKNWFGEAFRGIPQFFTVGNHDTG